MRDWDCRKWFARIRYHVFPLLLAGKLKNLANQEAPIKTHPVTLSSKAENLEAKSRISASAASESGSWQQMLARAEVLDQQIRENVHALVQSTLQTYNSQLKWSLRDLTANSVDEGLSIAKEFLKLADVASGEFGWSRHPFPEGMHWRKHCWKHIHETDLQRVADDVEAGRQPFFDDPVLDLLGSSEEALGLFRKAARCDPGAVARLHHLFPFGGTLRT